jgi:hypothetical protein
MHIAIGISCSLAYLLLEQLLAGVLYINPQKLFRFSLGHIFRLLLRSFGLFLLYVSFID